MSTARPETPPDAPPESTPQPSAFDVALRSLWHRYALKLAIAVAVVLAFGLSLLLARAATFRKAHTAGFERGRVVALRELELRMAQNDSIRHVGEMQAVRMLRNVRFFYLGRHSKGWCFLKYADASGPNWSTGWVADMRFMEPGKEYALDRNGTVWNRRR
jgi:hypothetical protein